MRGGKSTRTHCLLELWNRLKGNDSKYNDILTEVFQSTRDWYNLALSHPNCKHLDSLKQYLRKCAGNRAFQRMRYALLEYDGHDIDWPPVFLVIHRELIVALTYLLITGTPERLQPIEGRVGVLIESSVRKIASALDDHQSRSTWNKLWENATDQAEPWHEVLVSINQKAQCGAFGQLSDAFTRCTALIKESNDPAAIYIGHLASTIPAQTQVHTLFRNAQFEIVNGVIRTPEETAVATISQRLDGRWSLAYWAGSESRYRILAKTERDAILYAISKTSCIAVVSCKGKEWDVMILGTENSVFADYTANSQNDSGTHGRYKLEFWNRNHGLVVDDNEEVRMSVNDSGSKLVHILEGKVNYIDGAHVEMDGHFWTALQG